MDQYNLGYNSERQGNLGVEDMIKDEVASSVFLEEITSIHDQVFPSLEDPKSEDCNQCTSPKPLKSRGRASHRPAKSTRGDSTAKRRYTWSYLTKIGHDITHSDEVKDFYIKPEDCKSCNRGFSRLGDILRHILSYHTLKSLISCASCLSMFSRKDALRRHEGTCRGPGHQRKRRLRQNEIRVSGGSRKSTNEHPPDSKNYLYQRTTGT